MIGQPRTYREDFQSVDDLMNHYYGGGLLRTVELVWGLQDVSKALVDARESNDAKLIKRLLVQQTILKGLANEGTSAQMFREGALVLPSAYLGKKLAKRKKTCQSESNSNVRNVVT